MKKTLLLFSSIVMFTTAVAQSSQTQDTLHKEKMFVHQVGLQANQLIQQIFNFSNGAAAVTNPYLLTYSITHRKTGIGIRLGFGYTYKSFTQNDNITKTDTKQNDYQFRAGIEKMFKLSRRWTTGVGLDALFANNNDHTTSVVSSSDTTTIITNSKFPASGGGVMAWLRYHVTESILVGTEASFYYTSGSEKQDITETQTKFVNQVRTTVTTNTNADNKNAQGVFALPVVFYLLVQF